MDDCDGLTSLIEDIYDAALDAARWSDILPKVADFVGGQAALLSQDAVSGYGGALYHAGIDAHHLRLYTRTYRELDPAMLFVLAEGQVASISGIVPVDELREALFYREWMRPQGWIDAATAVLERTATRCTKLSIIRSEAQGIVDEEMRQRMQLITTHMRRDDRQYERSRASRGCDVRRHPRRLHGRGHCRRCHRTRYSCQYSGPRNSA
jgi:hypothetical protein